MADLAIMTVPIVDRSFWDDWMADVTGSGETNADHRDFLRQQGIRSEHVFVQETPGGTMMTLVWEGITQKEADAILERAMSDPSSEHVRFMVEELLPKAHGVSADEEPPPPPDHVATIEP